ncbi:DUF3892 domain-containing protein [Oenococcus sp. UCMA 16435]|nr:DUF3892 domain-containing protein [Oenococcus sp. UCMA 16435]MDI4584075.1 DUF3892 domain-containing protein [Oenococcus sp. UCMA 14587]
MKQEIIAIRLSNENKRIVAVKIKLDDIQKALGINNIIDASSLYLNIKDHNYEYFYTDNKGREAEVEVINGDLRDRAYIKTKADLTRIDNLLSLDRF